MNIEKRDNTWYALLTIPPDVRPALGKLRFCKSTRTSDKVKAQVVAILFVAQWKAEIAKVRMTLPDPHAELLENLRREYLKALQTDSHDDDGGPNFPSLELRDIIEAETSKISDPVIASRAYQIAIGQKTALAPLVASWKLTLRGAPKSIDQQSRDIDGVAEYFHILEALTPQLIKVWTDKLIAEGKHASTFSRLNICCRSFWEYLQHSAVRSMMDADPFVGPFKLAQRVAIRHKVGRSGSSYKPEQLAALYSGAIDRKDGPLVDLIALGAYTGARIQELCELTKDTVKDGVFYIDKSKTEAGIRECPIHPAIVPLVARMLAASKDGYLVPSTSKNKYGNRSHALSLRFGRLKKSMGFGPQHVFHSTRSTLISLMEQAGVVEGIAADIVGHAKKTMTYGLYGNGSVIQQKLKAITVVSYPAPLDCP